MQSQIFRIIDANSNRIGEGLRFLEDVARFIFNDIGLSQQLKTIRHDIVKVLNVFSLGLLTERDCEQDIGVKTELIENQDDLRNLIAANSKRAQEALRVI